MPLEKYEKNIYQCSKVACCKVITPQKYLFLPGCPMYEYYHWEPYYAGGWCFLGRKMITGEIKATKDLADILYTCTTCGMCDELCDPLNNIPLMEIMDEFRYDLVKAGVAPPAGLKKTTASLAKNHNPYGESHKKRSAWLKEKVPNKADVIYFVDSTTAYKTPEIAQATVEVLKAAGVKFGILDDEWDSGDVLFRTGQRDLAADVVKHNTDAIKKSGAKTVITSDPHAYASFKREYKLPRVEVLHTTQYFNDLIKAGKLKHKIIKDKVTYHDPCNLGRLGRGKFRGYQVVDPPREILQSLHVENSEMLRYGDRTWCCGGSGGCYFHLPDYVSWTATERLVEAEKTGAKSIVTACPMCKITLTEAAKKQKSPMKVTDISELIVKTL